jgi:hypothetical protein
MDSQYVNHYTVDLIDRDATFLGRTFPLRYRTPGLGSVKLQATWVDRERKESD